MSDHLLTPQMDGQRSKRSKRTSATGESIRYRRSSYKYARVFHTRPLFEWNAFFAKQAHAGRRVQWHCIQLCDSRKRSYLRGPWLECTRRRSIGTRTNRSCIDCSDAWNIRNAIATRQGNSIVQGTHSMWPTAEIVLRRCEPKTGCPSPTDCQYIVSRNRTLQIHDDMARFRTEPRQPD